jgi:rhodanese-related sulfurtransferase/DNA-binding transcriptional ArsR family regulator
MGHRQFKDKLYEQFARIGKALSSPRRLELLEILAQGERSVESLARHAGLSVANTSHHLQALREAGLVEARKDGLYVYYRIAGAEVFELVQTLRAVAERRLAEVERLVRSFVSARDELEPVTREDLLERVRSGEVVVLDVRPAEEYRAGHIQGAVSVPLDELEARMGELAPEVEVVAYCRGPYCVMAFDAVGLLRAHDRAARRLVDGFPEWQAAGLPVEAGPVSKQGA